jgi:hypothetical protein
MVPITRIIQNQPFMPSNRAYMRTPKRLRQTLDSQMDPRSHPGRNRHETVNACGMRQRPPGTREAHAPTSHPERRSHPPKHRSARPSTCHARSAGSGQLGRRGATACGPAWVHPRAHSRDETAERPHGAHRAQSASALPGAASGRPDGVRVRRRTAADDAVVIGPPSASDRRTPSSSGAV